jgi:hypothetical protein
LFSGRAIWLDVPDKEVWRLDLKACAFLRPCSA